MAWKTSPDDRYMTKADISNHLGISGVAVHNRIFNYYIDFPKPELIVKGYNYYNKEKILAYLEANPFVRKKAGGSKAKQRDIKKHIKPIDFITGRYDPTNKKTSAAMLKISAKLRKPKTQTIRIIGEW